MKAPLWLVPIALCLPTVPLAAQSVASRVVECGTDSRQRVLCAAGGEVVSAKLVREMSTGRCGPAGSWGWTGNAVWADNGCRGRFEVTHRRPADSTATRRITCGTLTTRRYECGTQGVADSVRLVRRTTFARCTQGSNWGYSDTLIWAGQGCRAEFEVIYRRAAATPPPAPAKPVTRTIACGKSSGELHTCTITGPVDTVQLVRDVGTTACRQRSNWDYAASFVWTRNGCRGMFQVTYRDTLAADSLEKPGTGRIVCGSSEGVQVNCRTNGYVTDVRLVQDLTRTRCREGSNWGHTDSTIWAGKGCRGEFEVSYRRVPPKGGGRLITCGSGAAIQVQCAAGGPRARARVVRNLGTTPCREGDNWRIMGSNIVAGRGCRAEFEVTFPTDSTPGMEPVRPGTTRVVSCGNSSGSAMSCNAFGTVATIRVQRDRSGGRCSQSSSWGLNDETVWVARGCYGDFEVTYAPR